VTDHWALLGHFAGQSREKGLSLHLRALRAKTTVLPQ
jgi:hypothetical protein